MLDLKQFKIGIYFGGYKMDMKWMKIENLNNPIKVIFDFNLN